MAIFVWTFSGVCDAVALSLVAIFVALLVIYLGWIWLVDKFRVWKSKK